MEEHLIEFVKNNKFLYNKRSRNYKNIFLRDKKFEELSVKLNIPAKKLKDRWRTLRDKFFKEIRKENLASGSGNPSPQKKWKWIEHLMFLKDVDNENTRTSGNFQQDWLSDGECSTSLSFLSDDHESTSVMSDHLIECSLSDNSPGATNASTPVNGKTKKVDDLLKEARNEMSEVVKLFKDSLAGPTTTSKTVAQDFFEILAKQSDEANLSPLEFSCLQIKMLNVLNETLQNKQQN